MKTIIGIIISTFLMGCVSTEPYVYNEKKKVDSTLSEGANLLLLSGQMSPNQLLAAIHDKNPRKAVSGRSDLTNAISVGGMMSLGASPLEAIGMALWNTRTQYARNFVSHGLIISNPSENWIRDIREKLAQVTGDNTEGEVSLTQRGYDQTNEYDAEYQLQVVYVAPPEKRGLNTVQFGDYVRYQVDGKQYAGVKILEIGHKANEGFEADFFGQWVALAHQSEKYTFYVPFEYDMEGKCLKSGYFLTENRLIDIPEITCEINAQQHHASIPWKR